MMPSHMMLAPRVEEPAAPNVPELPGVEVHASRTFYVLAGLLVLVLLVARR